MKAERECVNYPDSGNFFTQETPTAFYEVDITQFEPNEEIVRTENPGDCVVSQVIFEAADLTENKQVGGVTKSCPRCGNDVNCKVFKILK